MSYFDLISFVRVICNVLAYIFNVLLIFYSICEWTKRERGWTRSQRIIIFFYCWYFHWIHGMQINILYSLILSALKQDEVEHGKWTVTFFCRITVIMFHIPVLPCLIVWSVVGQLNIIFQFGYFLISSEQIKIFTKLIPFWSNIEFLWPSGLNSIGRLAPD